MMEVIRCFTSSTAASKTEAADTTFSVESVLEQLTVEEKVALLSGIDFWHTAPVHRLKVPSIRVSDGPNGVRGTRFFNGVPAACFPCGTAIGATWDKKLIKKAGALQGKEAIAKGASVILGPTVNIQRSPLGGRGFESFSEDPFLSGSIAAATIEGIQSTGVSATIKHFVCNDQEDQRISVDSILTERALREIYLMPFMIAQRDANPWCYMTAYNSVNGTHASENTKLLRDVLRNEWGFDGLVMSDWFGTYSTTEAIKAGLDLEMPGESYIRGRLVNQALTCGKLRMFDVDKCVRKVLELVKKVQPLGIPENAEERQLNTPETSETLRTISANGIVLMKNLNNVLPFKKDKSVAVIGPNADFAAYCGGGSAALAAYYTVTPLEAVKAQVKHAKYELGCPGWKELPLMSRLTKTSQGKTGLAMKVYLEPPSEKGRQVVDEVFVNNSNILLMDYKNPALTSTLFYIDIEGSYTPEDDDDYQFSLQVAGTGKVYVDGSCIVDNETKQRPGGFCFGAGTGEEIGTKRLQKGKTYDILTQFATLPTQKFRTPGVTSMGAGGLRLGLTRKPDSVRDLERAVQLAKDADQVILCTGLNADWESEGYDRQHMDLPDGNDELVKAICAANPNTAVVVQSGTPITMPWVHEAPAILQAWYGGNETGNAIADVIFGAVNPSGKLPLSFPIRNEDNPAFLNYKSERNRVLYGEDVYVGYRFYERTKKEVNFPFGHGLSYTTFDYSDLNLTSTKQNFSGTADADIMSTEDKIKVSLSVTNTGSRDGAAVVQVYVSQHNPSVNRPVKELKGFEKGFVKANSTQLVTVELDTKYATSWWDEQRDSWISEKGKYTVLVGDSSAHTPLSADFEVAKTSWWNGL